MAHECPECGQACYCNGDIDDCFFENTPEQMNCKHWKECDDEDGDDQADDYYEDDDPLDAVRRE